ncbi:MAG: hypothetical protein BWY65_01915 [Firmicutes bacterium ADurb.Bin373]|nr:MAG: hypothetical protein BWY65_01915 [Firmicutes bacterium ADurb.Bin373]
MKDLHLESFRILLNPEKDLLIMKKYQTTMPSSLLKKNLIYQNYQMKR